MSNLKDLYLSYEFLKKLTTPFDQWEAYKLGIIDKEGNQLKLIQELKTQKEKDAFGYFDLLILHLKQLLAKIPGGESKIGTYAAALLLLKQYPKVVHEDYHLFKELPFILQECVEEVQAKLSEDGVPANAVGTGAIAGAGVGPQGEPGFTPKVMKKYKEANQQNAPTVNINSLRRIMKGNLK
jgi:hypothetical protein